MTYRREYAVFEAKRGGELEQILEPFLVPTPRVYVVDLSSYSDEAEKNRVKEKLLEKVQALNKVFDILNISLKQAYELDYSLNRATREVLMGIARHYQLIEAQKLILKYLD